MEWRLGRGVAESRDGSGDAHVQVRATRVQLVQDGAVQRVCDFAALSILGGKRLTGITVVRTEPAGLSDGQEPYER